MTAAIETCPKKAHRQLAFLHVLAGGMVHAAKFLAQSPGRGWSQSEHPGHLLFPMFCRFLGNTLQDPGRNIGRCGSLERDMDELEMLAHDCSGPRLQTSSVDDLLALAGIATVADASARAAMLKAMRKAAEKRLDGVTANKGRRSPRRVACSSLHGRRRIRCL